MVLMEWSTGGGEHGRCDGHCHNAKHGRCRCICQGMNHGVGLRQAIENTRSMAETWLRDRPDAQVRPEVWTWEERSDRRGRRRRSSPQLSLLEGDGA